MPTINVAGWERWQTYRKDRGTPPWIKVHRNLLSNPEWAELTDAEKGQLLSIWIVAADKEGQITANARALQKICQLDGEPNINKFIDLGFLEASGCQPAAMLPPTSRQDAAPETETETETETELNTSAPAGAGFEDWWKEWPKKVGKKPCKAIWKRRRLGQNPGTEKLVADIHARQKRDRRWVEGFIPNPQTYLNQDRWEDEIQPISQEAPGLPKRNEDLVAWAKKRGIETSPGEDWDAFRTRCERTLARMH